MRYLHGHTWGRTVHTQFWILLQITNNNKKGTHMLPWGCSCYGDSLFGVRSVSGGGLCEWTLCSGSLWIWHHHGWKRSTWASLHEASAAHSRTDMPGWLMCPLTLYGVMSLECIQINCVKSVKNEIHDEHGISFSSFLCYFQKKECSEIILTKRPSSSTEHKIYILLTANETPQVHWYGVKIWENMAVEAAEQQLCGIKVALSSCRHFEDSYFQTWVSVLGFRWVTAPRSIGFSGWKTLNAIKNKDHN